jgi:hyperosmotically inducible periplasmic protein
MKVKYFVALMALIVALMTIVAPVRASVTDDRIVSSAKDSHIWKTYLKGDDIKIESKDGAVMLTGVVAEGSHKALAAETVESLPGVKSVDNQLTVKGAAPTTDSDAAIAEKVKITLLVHRSTSASKTDVSVKDGKVTLRGDATSQAQKDLTTEYAKDVEGVKDVDNQMTVASTKSSAKTAADKVTDKVTEKVDDASISAQVKYALMVHRSTSAIKTKVSTENGQVTLSGKAKNAAEKTLVTKLVNDINGVKSVKNEMTIE